MRSVLFFRISLSTEVFSPILKKIRGRTLRVLESFLSVHMKTHQWLNTVRTRDRWWEHTHFSTAWYLNSRDGVPNLVCGIGWIQQLDIIVYKNLRFQKSKREEFPVGNPVGKRASPSFLTSFSLTQNLMLRLYWNGWEEVLLFQAKPRFKINVYFVELTIFLLYWATKTVSKKSCLNSKHTGGI